MEQSIEEVRLENNITAGENSEAIRVTGLRLEQVNCDIFYRPNLYFLSSSHFNICLDSKHPRIVSKLLALFLSVPSILLLIS